MKKRKNKAQQAVAAVVMGMNLVNTMSPLALAAQAPAPRRRRRLWNTPYCRRFCRQLKAWFLPGQKRHRI